MKNLFHILVIITAVVILPACGGGGSSNTVTQEPLVTQPAPTIAKVSLSNNVETDAYYDFETVVFQIDLGDIQLQEITNLKVMLSSESIEINSYDFMIGNQNLVEDTDGSYIIENPEFSEIGNTASFILNANLNDLRDDGGVVTISFVDMVAVDSQGNTIDFEVAEDNEFILTVLPAKRFTRSNLRLVNEVLVSGINTELANFAITTTDGFCEGYIDIRITSSDKISSDLIQEVAIQDENGKTYAGDYYYYYSSDESIQIYFRGIASENSSDTFTVYLTSQDGVFEQNLTVSQLHVEPYDCTTGLSMVRDYDEDDILTELIDLLGSNFKILPVVVSYTAEYFDGQFDRNVSNVAANFELSLEKSDLFTNESLLKNVRLRYVSQNVDMNQNSYEIYVRGEQVINYSVDLNDGIIEFKFLEEVTITNNSDLAVYFRGIQIANSIDMGITFNLESFRYNIGYGGQEITITGDEGFPEITESVIRVEFDEFLDANQENKVILAGQSKTVLSVNLSCNVDASAYSARSVYFTVENYDSNFRDSIINASLLVNGSTFATNTNVGINANGTIHFNLENPLILCDENIELSLIINTANIGSNFVGKAQQDLIVTSILISDIQDSSENPVDDVSYDFQSKAFSIAPAIVTAEVNDSFGIEDDIAEVRLSVDSGNNTDENGSAIEVELTQLNLQVRTFDSDCGITIFNENNYVITSGVVSSNNDIPLNLTIIGETIDNDNEVYRFERSTSCNISIESVETSMGDFEPEDTLEL